MRKITMLLAALLMLPALASTQVGAQTTGTETVPDGETYFEGNFWTGTQSHSNGGMQVYGGRFARGFRHKVELGMGFSMSDPHDPEYPPEIQPSVKWRFYENERRGLSAAGGVVGFVPVARRAGTDAFAMIYTNVTKEIKSATVTVGGYALVGRNKEFGSRKGWNFVYDQSINDKVSFSMQWVTGKNRFGYLTPGFTFYPTTRSNLFVGYSVGNSDYDNHGPFISYSITR
ncbi:MAG: hypothetical protein IPN69_17355 [Acidobacteria bacterium]|nr:hypothetical protein [Acidobacteriota bacterium]